LVSKGDSIEEFEPAIKNSSRKGKQISAVHWVRFIHMGNSRQAGQKVEYRGVIASGWTRIGSSLHFSCFRHPERHPRRDMIGPDTTISAVMILNE